VYGAQGRKGMRHVASICCSGSSLSSSEDESPADWNAGLDEVTGVDDEVIGWIRKWWKVNSSVVNGF
jgi:hypothetical protein